MSFAMVVPAHVSEWGWLFAFAVVSLALVAAAVLADALYEGYRARLEHAHHRSEAGVEESASVATGSAGEQEKSKKTVA